MPEYEQTDPDERRMQEDERRLEVSIDALAREIMEVVGCSYGEARENIGNLFHQQRQRDEHNEIEITEEHI